MDTMTREGARLPWKPQADAFSTWSKGSGHRWQSPSAGYEGPDIWLDGEGAVDGFRAVHLMRLSPCGLNRAESRVWRAIGNQVCRRGTGQRYSCQHLPPAGLRLPSIWPPWKQGHPFWGPVVMAQVGRSEPRYLGVWQGTCPLGTTSLIQLMSWWTTTLKR